MRSISKEVNSCKNTSLSLKKHPTYIALLLALIFTASPFLSNASESEKKKGFNAGEMIMHHVLDAHDIHIMDGLTIPLPVILYTDNGIDVFSFSNFYDENHSTTSVYKSESTGYAYAYNHGHVYIADESGMINTDEAGLITNVAPLDFSITKNVVGMLLSIIIMFLIFLSVAKGYTTNRGKAPKGIQSFMEPLILFIRDEVAKPSIGRGYEKFMPFLLSIFFFIWIANMLGIIPFLGGLNVTGNIGVTAVLAMFTFVITSFSANKGYWSHIIMPPGVPLWLLPIMIPIELIGVVSKPLVLCLRLFANITAGHIIILSFGSLIFIFQASSGDSTAWGVSIGSTVFLVFMNCLELLVAFLQAYVFTLLSALYFGMATEEAH